MIRKLITGLALTASISSHAATVTFDAISHADEWGTSYVEAGISFNSMGGDLGYYGAPGVIHLDDFGTALTSGVIVTTGSTFTPESVNLIGFREVTLNYVVFDPIDPDATWTEGTVVTTGVLVRGYRGSEVVAEDRLSAPVQSNYVFGSGFSKIDALEIIADVDMESPVAMLEQEYPGYVIAALDCDDEAPCSHFEVDSISINTTPEKRECPRAKKKKPRVSAQ